MEIQPYSPAMLDAVVRIALRAWEPVFRSIEQALGPDIYREQYPDWRASQAKAVGAACEEMQAWVAVADGAVAGFAALRMHREDRMGEIYMIAVDPDFQRRGIAAALTRHALERLKEAGMTTAMVETGGDPGHAPARRTYEAAGFELFPVARYFKRL